MPANRVVAFIRTPVGFGSILLAITTFFVGFAMAAQQNIVSNYFEFFSSLSRRHSIDCRWHD